MSAQLCRLPNRCDDRPAARPNTEVSNSIAHHPTCRCISPRPETPAHQLLYRQRPASVFASCPACCLAQAPAPAPLPPLRDRCSRNTESVSGHHHQDDHGILNRQQRVGATTATGTIIRVAGQQSFQWTVSGLQLIEGSDRVSVSHLFAVLYSAEHPAEAIRGGKNHGSKARRSPREGEPDIHATCRIIRLTIPTKARKRHHPAQPPPRLRCDPYLLGPETEQPVPAAREARRPQQGPRPPQVEPVRGAQPRQPAVQRPR